MEEHHGGLKNHPTMITKRVIDYYASKTLEQNNMGVILKTYISAAKLMSKLDYHSIQDSEYNLFKSYYTVRYTYVQINTKKSQLQKCGEYGVVRGSKLSGKIYSLYTNEIQRLHLILSTQL